jgi:hypothetical protein
MRIISTIEDEKSVKRILRHLGLWPVRASRSKEIHTQCNEAIYLLTYKPEYP